MTKRILTVVLGAFIVGSVVYAISMAVEAFERFPQRHAESCLIEITEIADRAVNHEIPEGLFGDAISRAEYIDSYYPVGAVVREDHPFAERYSEERRKQIERITDALKDATGTDFGTNWSEWKDEFGPSKFDLP